MEIASAGILLVVGLLVAAFVFLLVRALLLWYFRLNEIAETLKQIAHTNAYIAAQIPPQGFPPLSKRP